MGPPPVTDKLVRRLDRAHDAFGVAWLQPRVDANDPAAPVLRRFGGAVAAVTPSRPELDFLNRVQFPDAVGEELEAMLDFYSDRGVRPWIELRPGEERLAARLAAAGARPIAAYTVLYGLPVVPAAPAVDVELVGPEAALRCAELLLEGHGVPEGPRVADAPAIAALAAREGISFYLAYVEGAPAAAAILALGDGIGLLANASTLPASRGRGCQSALIARRIADAAGAGCELVSSGASFASQSQRNLERAGLRVAYVKTVWRVERAV
jgi:GNAT superfamily N-acetyltransferase